MQVGPNWPEDHIFPVVGGRLNEESGTWTAWAVTGTAFAFGGWAVTCWHVVRGLLDEGLEVGINFKDDDGNLVFEAVSFEQRGGHDIAIAPMSWAPLPPLRQGPPLHEGMNVYAYGYPLTEQERGVDGVRRFRWWLRLFRGYVVSATILPVEGYREAGVVELDMPCPGGLSGAPLLRDNPAQGGTFEVVGMVQGQVSITEGTSPPLVLGRAYARDELFSAIP